MTDTLFADVSEFNPQVTDVYPYQFFSFRSNDGTYRDHHFTLNLAWAKHAADTGRLAGFLVYFVWEPNWQDTVATFKAMVGTPHPKMAVMLDVESWSGKIRGNQSAGINAAREALIAWLHGNRRRVIGYANAGDFAALWPSRGDARVVLANYSANPAFPGKIAHQFSSSYPVPPFGKCDINSADGLSPTQFAAALGIGVPAPKPKPTPAPAVEPTPARSSPQEGDMRIAVVDPAECRKKNVTWPGWFTTDGYTLTHIATVARRDALLRLGYPSKKISLADYYALGGH